MFRGFGSCIDLVRVERNAEFASQCCGKLLVAVSLGAAQTVVEMCGVQDDAQLGSAGSEGAGESDRVGSTGEADGQTQAGPQQGCVEREGRNGSGWRHSTMVNASPTAKTCRRKLWDDHPNNMDPLLGPRRCILHWLCRYLPYSPPLALGRGWPRPSPSNFSN